jgi:hypothetical protein
MKFTLNQAAREVGLAKATLWRAIKSGKISASKDLNGVYEVDGAELFRVFQKETDNVSKKQHATPENDTDTALTQKIEMLECVIQSKDSLINAQSEWLKELKSRLDESERERRETGTAYRALLAGPEKNGSRRLAILAAITTGAIVSTAIYHLIVKA